MDIKSIHRKENKKLHTKIWVSSIAFGFYVGITVFFTGYKTFTRSDRWFEFDSLLDRVLVGSLFVVLLLIACYVIFRKAFKEVK